jgi:hypothetical protein
VTCDGISQATGKAKPKRCALAFLPAVKDCCGKMPNRPIFRSAVPQRMLFDYERHDREK